MSWISWSRLSPYVGRVASSIERVALGVGNVFSGQFGGTGGCAMIGQTVVNVASGGKRLRLPEARSLNARGSGTFAIPPNAAP